MTGTDLVPHPATAELVDLGAGTDHLGRTILEVRDLEGKLRDFKDAIGGEVLARMDHEQQWTVHLAGISLSAPRPGGEEWDAKTLEAGLKALVKRGLLGETSLEKVIGYEPKAKKRGVDGLKAIAAAQETPEEVREALGSLLARARKPPKKRSITIEVPDA